MFAGIAGAHVRTGASLEEARRRLERRFAALLGAHVDDLPRHLRHAVYLAKSENVPVDYVTLLRDLRHWDSERHWVQQRWAASFWAGNATREHADKHEAIGEESCTKPSASALMDENVG